jgi:hypothetical protein
VIAHKIQHPRRKWFNENFVKMTKLFFEAINELKLTNMTTISAISMTSQKLKLDEVQLTVKAGFLKPYWT